MNPEELFVDFRTRSVGRPVSFTRLAGNSFLLFVDATPGSRTGITFWFEPTWHYRNAERVLTGSREAQHEPGEPNPNAGFERAAAFLNKLDGRTVVDVRLHAVTGDLYVELSDQHLLRTFVSDPSTDELWHIRDNATGVYLRRTGRDLIVETGEV